MILTVILLIRPSVADLDGDGAQDVVTVLYGLGSGVSNVYAIEKQPWYSSWRQRYGLSWNVNIPVSYPLLPPTLADIDSDSKKEILVGLQNGTLIAYEANNSNSEKWRYKFSPKLSVLLGETFVEFGGGTAVSDIDLDGSPEVITADMGSRVTYDWPGEVYLINGATGVKEGNATFGNGGTFGSVSIANVDSDDNPEIIVPSFYGVYVYDYDSSAPNKLTKKCNTDDSLIDGSVVVYDVDRDNHYELIYTTTTMYCSPYKSCYNRLYIVDAETCVDEADWPINLNVYSRVTPTIANLDTDSNLEIVISGRLNTEDEYGKILAYDASTRSLDGSFDNEGTLKTAFVAPDIADIDGDGKYDIIFAENNGSNVYVLWGNLSEKFHYNFNAFVDSALAIADIDGDGKAEIAMKKSGSPIGILAIAGSFNQQPHLGSISNFTGKVGDLIDLNATGEIAASDPNGDILTFSFSSPFNSSGKWQTTVNDTGNYSILVEVSDGNLTDYKYVDVLVFSAESQCIANFTDGSPGKLFNFTAAANQTVSIRLPKNASILYSRLRLEGKSS
jgi:hypothetical protein